MDSGFLGIKDPWVLAAYLLCVASALLCVIYGLATWNRGDDSLHKEDVDWAAEERQIEEDL